MQTMHLFAGAGGGLLADLILGHTPVVAVEWDAYCCKVLRERAAEGWFPDLYVYEGDIRMFDPSEYKGRVDCIHAGFPCQPHSVAGKRKGEDDERNLWPDTARIIGDIRPQFVMLENVPGIVSTGYVWTVIGDLAEMGYDARWGIISAADVGAPHLRERWWCFAKCTNADVSRRDKTLTVRKRREQREESSSVCTRSFTNPDNDRRRIQQVTRKERKDSTVIGNDGTKESMADSEKLHRNGVNDNAEISMEHGPLPELGNDGRQKTVAHTNGDRSQGRSGVGSHEATRGRKHKGCEVVGTVGEEWGYWEIEPDVGRVANGVASRVDRLKSLGNGQVPLQAALAWKILGGP